MSQIAEETGIGRATLYKYFSDVEAILIAWHERQVTGHLEYLAQVRDRAGTAPERLEAVLEAYAQISHEQHDTELASLLHRGEHVARAEQQLTEFVRDLLTEGAETGDLRDDVPPDEPTAATVPPAGSAISRHRSWPTSVAATSTNNPLSSPPRRTSRRRAPVVEARAVQKTTTDAPDPILAPSATSSR